MSGTGWNGATGTTRRGRPTASPPTGTLRPNPTSPSSRAPARCSASTGCPPSTSSPDPNARLAVGSGELVLRVQPVLAEHLAGALDDGEVGFGRSVPVGGDAVGRPLRVVPVAPFQPVPLVRVVGVGGDQPEPGRVGAGREAERVDVDHQQEVERLDLLRPALAAVPASKRPPQRD